MELHIQEEKPESSFDVIVIYNRRRLIIDYERGTSLFDFCQLLKMLLDISQPELKIILIDVLLDAEVTSEKSLKKERNYEVQVREGLPNPCDHSNTILASTSSFRPQEEQNQNEVSDAQASGIPFQDLINRKFTDKDLLTQINIWAAKFKFKMRKCEGIKEMKEGFKRTLKCSESLCDYKLYFTSKDQETDFCVFDKLSRKHNKHSKVLLLFSFFIS